MKLKAKNIVLGVSGGIAAYKAAELVRLFQKEGADVRVVMTRSAAEFVTPLTLRSLSGHPVLTALFESDAARGSGDADESGIEHIELVKNADLVVVAPATANTLAKAAWGLADDALGTVLVAAGANILWAPAMNHRMWKNPVTRENVSRLKQMGHGIVDPDEGWMACREYGVGRMAEPSAIVRRVVEMIGGPQDLEKVRVLVTAGRTEEPLDPVRILTNRSSGKMGVALAEEALSRGAEVTLLAGPVDVPLPESATVERVTTAEEMATAADRLFPQCEVLVMAAAVGDFRATEPRTKKMSRASGEVQVSLTSNKDILAGLAAKRQHPQILIGFALEPGGSGKAARKKLEQKNVDLLVVNDPNEPGAAIGGDTNVVTLLEPGKNAVKLDVLPKRVVARRVFDWVVERREDLARRVPAHGSQGRTGDA